MTLVAHWSVDENNPPAPVSSWDASLPSGYTPFHAIHSEGTVNKEYKTRGAVTALNGGQIYLQDGNNDNLIIYNVSYAATLMIGYVVDVSGPYAFNEGVPQLAVSSDNPSHYVSIVSGMSSSDVGIEPLIIEAASDLSYLASLPVKDYGKLVLFKDVTTGYYSGNNFPIIIDGINVSFFVGFSSLHEDNDTNRSAMQTLITDLYYDDTVFDIMGALYKGPSGSSFGINTTSTEYVLLKDNSSQPSLKAIINDLDYGALSNSEINLILDHIDEASENVKQNSFVGKVGYDPIILQNPANAYMDEILGYSYYQDNKIEIETSVFTSDAVEVDGEYELGDPYYRIYEETTIWQDATNIHFANLFDGEPQNIYSFYASTNKTNDDFNKYKDFVVNGEIDNYLVIANSAYQEHLNSGEFAEVYFVFEGVKDSSNNVNLKVYTVGSWFGLESNEAHYGGTPGTYSEWAELWGFEAKINSEGNLETLTGYNGHFAEREFIDLNYQVGDPTPPLELTSEDIALLDLSLDGESWGLIYQVFVFEFSTDSVSITLPNYQDFPQATSSHGTYLFGLDNYF